MEQLGESFAGDTPPPWLYVKGRLVQFYHCLPSELADEDLSEICWIKQLVDKGDEILEAQRRRNR
jgi:hypothetical protein